MRLQQAQELAQRAGQEQIVLRIGMEMAPEFVQYGAGDSARTGGL
jgi:hypothetical protein